MYLRLIFAQSNSIFLFQFKCENGRIVLPLKCHEWNQSDFSAKFSSVTSAKEFEAKWLEEMSGSAPNDATDSSTMPSPMSTSTQSEQSSRLAHASTPTSSGFVQSDRPPKRRHGESKSSQGASHSSFQSGILSESPSKRCKFIKEGIDERIERCRKGKYIKRFRNTPLIVSSLCFT